MKHCLDLLSLSYFRTLVLVISFISHTCFLMLLPWRTLRFFRTVEKETHQGKIISHQCVKFNMVLALVLGDLFVFEGLSMHN